MCIFRKFRWKQKNPMIYYLLISFFTYSSEELTFHYIKKHCHPNVKLCAQQSPGTFKEKVKLLFKKKHKISPNINFY